MLIHPLAEPIQSAVAARDSGTHREDGWQGIRFRFGASPFDLEILKAARS